MFSTLFTHVSWVDMYHCGSTSRTASGLKRECCIINESCVVTMVHVTCRRGIVALSQWKPMCLASAVSHAQHSEYCVGSARHWNSSKLLTTVITLRDF